MARHIPDPEDGNASLQCGCTGVPGMENRHNNSKYLLNEESVSAETLTIIDEEAMFDMPSLIDSMAEGLLLTPPVIPRVLFPVLIFS
ncbi:hypothetical protein LguiA_007349 [Lonicera macranthoides]